MALICLDGSEYPVLRAEKQEKRHLGCFFAVGLNLWQKHETYGGPNCGTIFSMRYTAYTGGELYESLDLEPRTLSGAPSTEFWTKENP